MRTLSSSLVIALLLSVAAVPTADAWMGSSLNASVTKYDIRAAAKAKRSTPKKTARPASVELPAAAKGGLLWGDLEATTTIVMFTDIECPFCQRFHAQTFPALKKDYIDTKKVRFVVRHFPLSFHKNAYGASEAVVCARSQSDEKARLLYEKLIVSSKLAASDIVILAAGVEGMDVDALADCMEGDSAAKTIESDQSLAKDAKVSGTPSFLIIGPTGLSKQITGAYPIDSFKAAIEAVQAAK
jgi:protein-disulfide isomerase